MPAALCKAALPATSHPGSCRGPDESDPAVLRRRTARGSDGITLPGGLRPPPRHLHGLLGVGATRPPVPDRRRARTPGRDGGDGRAGGLLLRGRSRGVRLSPSGGRGGFVAPRTGGGATIRGGRLVTGADRGPGPARGRPAGATGSHDQGAVRSPRGGAG